ncbi:MAG: DMT family transporter [Ignavibacteria bacterium]|nr:DMT family transporter [Ignavibacteria bacterium]
MFLGFLAATGTLLSWSVGTFAFLRASRKIDPGLLNRARLMLAVCATLILASVTVVAWPWEIVTRTTFQSWLWLGLSGIVGLTIGDLFGFTSLRILGARRQSVIGTLSPAAAAAAALLLLNEHISLIDIAGITITLVGVITATYSSQEKDDVANEGYGSFFWGAVLGVGGAIFQGVGLVLAKKGMMSDSGLAMIAPFHATFVRMTIGFMATYALDVLRRAPHRPLRDAFSDSPSRNAMLLGALSGPVIGVTLSLLAAQQLPAAIAQTIFSLVPFVVMIIARIVYHEPLRLRSVLGAVISVIGVLILVMY